MKHKPDDDRTVSVQQPAQITPEMYRNYRNQMRADQIKERSQNMNDLFVNYL